MSLERDSKEGIKRLKGESRENEETEERD